MNAGVLTVAPQVSRESRGARVSRTLLGAALAVAVGAAPVMAEEGPGPGFSGHRARVASDITQRLAAAPGASSDVIVRGSPDVIHALSTKHGLRVKRSLKSGAVVELTAASLAALAGDPGVPAIAADRPDPPDDVGDDGVDGCGSGVARDRAGRALHGSGHWRRDHRFGRHRGQRPARPHRGPRRLRQRPRPRPRLLRSWHAHRGHHRRARRRTAAAIVARPKTSSAAWRRARI